MNASPSIKQRKSRRILVTSVSIALMLTVLLIVLYLLRTSEETVTRKPQFDPDAVVRLFDITRVYRIRPAQHDSTVLWFATAEGIRVLETETMQWHRYGLDHGLPSETIVDVCFADSTAWVATWNGIARLDHEARRFRRLPFGFGLGTTRILSIEHVDGWIYFAVDGRGLHRVGVSDSVPEHVELPGLRAGSRITCLKRDGDRLIIGAEGRRVLVHRPESGAFQELLFNRPGNEDTYVWDVSRYKGDLWVATSDDGLWRGGAADSVFTPVPDFPAKGAYVFANTDQGFYCGTPFGLWKYYDHSGGAWIQLIHPDEKQATDFQVFTLASIEHQLWYGSMDLGAGFLRKERLEWQPMRAGLSRSNVVAVATRDSTLWTAYGYQGGTIDRFLSHDIQYDRNYNYVDGITDPQIQCFAPTSDRLYYGGYRSFGYIDLRTGRDRHFDADNGLEHTDVADIGISADSTLLLATIFGLYRYFPESDSFQLFPETEGTRITCLHEQGERVWLGTLARGVKLFNRSSGEIERSWLDDAMRITAIVPGPGADFYFVTKQSGTYRLRDGETLEKLSVPRQLLDKDTQAPALHTFAARGIDERLWIGTRGLGCLIYDMNTGQWVRYSWYDGLVSDNVQALWNTDRHIWVGCYGGLNRLDKSYINRILFKNSSQREEDG